MGIRGLSTGRHAGREDRNYHRQQAGRSSSPTPARSPSASPASAQNDIVYEFTVEDPEVYTQVWKGEIPWRRINESIYEYACHGRLRPRGTSSPAPRTGTHRPRAGGDQSWRSSADVASPRSPLCSDHMGGRIIPKCVGFPVAGPSAKSCDSHERKETLVTSSVHGLRRFLDVEPAAPLPSAGGQDQRRPDMKRPDLKRIAFAALATLRWPLPSPPPWPMPNRSGRNTPAMSIRATTAATIAGPTGGREAQDRLARHAAQRPLGRPRA